jgi:hypothetical protein
VNSDDSKGLTVLAPPLTSVVLKTRKVKNEKQTTEVERITKIKQTHIKGSCVIQLNIYNPIAL